MLVEWCDVRAGGAWANLQLHLDGRRLRGQCPLLVARRKCAIRCSGLLCPRLYGCRATGVRSEGQRERPHKRRTTTHTNCLLTTSKCLSLKEIPEEKFRTGRQYRSSQLSTSALDLLYLRLSIQRRVKRAGGFGLTALGCRSG